MRKPMQLVFFGALALVLASVAAAGDAPAGVAPGDAAPAFTLTDTEGGEHALASYLADGKVVVLEWFNADCPFIKKHHLNHKTMNETYAAVADKGVVWLCVCSSAKGKQGHGQARNRYARSQYEMEFPVLLDEDGAVGRAYGAKTTPHMFVIAPDGTVAYAGAIDDDNSANKLGATNYVSAALAAVLAGKAPAVAEARPYGCSVKYAN